MKRCLSCSSTFQSAGWTCPNCGRQPELRKSLPCFAPDLEAQTADYDPALHRLIADLEQSNFWFMGRASLLSWTTRKFAPRATRVFEIGCGTGLVLRTLVDTLPRASFVASDVHVEALDVARERLDDAVEFIQMDARAIPYRGEFDLIGCFDVVEHLEDAGPALSEIFAGLVPGGIAIVTVPQHAWLWSPSDVAAGHKRRYSRTLLRRQLETAGFDLLFLTSFMSLLLPAMALARWREKATGSYDVRSAFDMPRIVNAALAAVFAGERALIRAGVRFPAGGSLLAVARRPA